MQNPKLTIDFDTEEERLLAEFKNISGVSKLMSTTSANYTNMSGIALELLAEQDNTRLLTAIDSNKLAVKIIAKYVLRLYKQYAVLPRLLKIAGESGSVQLYYWDKNEICSDDVVFDSTTNSVETLAQRRTMLLDLIKQGLLFNENGTFSQSTRKRCLDLLGFGTWENSTDINTLQVDHAKEENLAFTTGEVVEILSIDNHEIHIEEHSAYILSGELKNKLNSKVIKEKLLKHIADHKQELKKQIEQDKGE